MMDNCLLCDEPIEPEPMKYGSDSNTRSMTEITTDVYGRPVGRMRQIHRECGLREVVGGVGHLVAHEYWCEQKHNPDAGFSYRESARIVWAIVSIIGTERVVGIGDPSE
jgi:hypothetical protein